jgi:hypothetical protein
LTFTLGCDIILSEKKERQIICYRKISTKKSEKSARLGRVFTHERHPLKKKNLKKCEKNTPKPLDKSHIMCYNIDTKRKGSKTMQIEIYEKVGEVSVLELRSAEENRAIAEAEMARKQEVVRLVEEKKQCEATTKCAELIPAVMEAINKTAENGKTTLPLLWTKDHPTQFGLNFDEWSRCIEMLTLAFDKLGYKFFISLYSASWSKKSGKIGHGYIWW